MTLATVEQRYREREREIEKAASVFVGYFGVSVCECVMYV